MAHHPHCSCQVICIYFSILIYSNLRRKISAPKTNIEKWKLYIFCTSFFFLQVWFEASLWEKRENMLIIYWVRRHSKKIWFEWMFCRYKWIKIRFKSNYIEFAERNQFSFTFFFDLWSLTFSKCLMMISAALRFICCHSQYKFNKFKHEKC